MILVGFGYDVHRLVEGRPLILGGCRIPHTRGLQGHSDADVLTHAVMDAILGALGKGDIGRHFPDKDPSYEGADSLHLLARVMEWVGADRYRINNLDTTIVAQAPRLMSYIPAMEENLARVLRIPAERINVKATTTEGLGFAGRGEGIAAYAMVTLTAESPKADQGPGN
ncbi:MAG: 2-C-methyl-D-erythritol 2,4-cyclodiphosphate synthase [Deltaproteobacteria bacterium]|nr:2-C-methyl-D-erythritol 2,4-cyclodiphosphate synthase [Deltaproteobacteria bacterium]